MTSERDQVADELTKLVGHLIRKRDAGLPGRPIAEQRAHREGFTAAIRAVASSALLVVMLQEPDAR